MGKDTDAVDQFQASIESAATRLAAEAGSDAFSRWLPDDPSRQAERDRFRGLAIAQAESA